MHKKTALAGAAALAAGLVTATSAAASEPVHVDVATSFAGESFFTSDLDGCESGSVGEGRSRVLGTGRFGIYNGFKVFSCDEGGEFVIRLHATFTEAGATGTWAFVGGDYVGSGTLVGVPFGDGTGITDVYDGTLR